MKALNRIIRPMDLRDVDQVSEIEKAAFPPPWPATNFRRDLTSNSLTHYRVVYEQQPGSVSIDNSSQSLESKFGMLKSGISRFVGSDASGGSGGQLILGFAAVWFLVDEAHLSNIAVHQMHLRQGVGEQLLIAIIELAIENNAQFVTLEVRYSNQAAKAMYKKYDFVEVGIRPRYYTDNKEDAVLMTADMIGSERFKNKLRMLKEAYTHRWGVKV